MKTSIWQNRLVRMVTIAGVLLCLTACSGLSRREQRILSGGAIGSAAGVGVAAIAGGPLIVGGAAGAAAGAIGGLVLDELDKR